MKKRTFSKLKIIKKKLRANLNNENLENLMLCNVKYDILAKINNNEIINRYGYTQKDAHLHDNEE